MRISTAQFFESTSATYQNNFSSVIKTQQQIDSGVRIQTAADDPVGAARLLQLQQQKDMLAQYTGKALEVTNLLTAGGATVYPYCQLDGRHCEADWRRQLGRCFTFLFGWR